MVSNGKMDKLSHWIIYFICICFLWNDCYANNRSAQYSSIRIHKEALGEIYLFILNVMLSKIGKKLDKGYRCPVYCKVDHKHLYWEEDETKKSNIQTVNELYRTVRDTSKEQRTSSIRYVPSSNRLCRNEG